MPAASKTVAYSLACCPTMGPDLWVGSFILMTSSSTAPTGPISLCAPASQNCALANSEAGNVWPLGSVRYTMRPIISWICKGWAPEAGRHAGLVEVLDFGLALPKVVATSPCKTGGYQGINFKVIQAKNRCGPEKKLRFENQYHTGNRQRC